MNTCLFHNRNSPHLDGGYFFPRKQTAWHPRHDGGSWACPLNASPRPRLAPSIGQLLAQPRKRPRTWAGASSSVLLVSHVLFFFATFMINYQHQLGQALTSYHHCRARAIAVHRTVDLPPATRSPTCGMVAQSAPRPIVQAFSVH